MKKNSLIIILGILILIVVIAYRIFEPHQRTKSTESQILIPGIGTIWKTKSEYFQDEQQPIINENFNSNASVPSSNNLPENSTNIALHKPVIYQSKQIILRQENGKAKLWDRDSFYEKYSINQGHYPSNLTDGNRATMAYPASWFFDYIIDLEEVYPIKKIVIYWGNFGVSPKYITNWKIYTQTELETVSQGNKWELLQEGNCPGSLETVLNKNVNARRVRIMAESTNPEKGVLVNWIGVHELEIYSTN